MVFGFGLLLGLILYSSNNEAMLDDTWVSVLDFVLSLFIYVGYYILMEHSMGTSIGKMITGTVVVSEDGTKPSFSQIVGRSFARLIPFEPFSFLGDEGWHDSLSRTRVVLKSEVKNQKSNDKLLDDWE